LQFANQFIIVTTRSVGNTERTDKSIFLINRNPQKRPYDRMAPSESDKPYMYAADENGDPWSPGWFTLNFKTSYNLSNRAEFTAGIENMLDLRYRPYSSGIASPGRNFIFSVRIMI